MHGSSSQDACESMLLHPELEGSCVAVRSRAVAQEVHVRRAEGCLGIVEIHVLHEAGLHRLLLDSGFGGCKLHGAAPVLGAWVTPLEGRSRSR